jgi:predicted outer membrane lipoprotein
MTIGQQGDLAAFGVMNQLRKELCEKYALKGEEF